MKKNALSGRTSVWLAGIVLSVCFGKAEAGDVVNTFTSGSSVIFGTASNWNPSGIPGATDDVTVSGLTATTTVQFRDVTSLGSFLYGTSGGNLAMISYSADRDFGVSGALTVDGGASRSLILRDGGVKLKVSAGSVSINSGIFQLGTSTQPLNSFTAGSTTVAENTLLQVRQIATSASFGNTALSGATQLNATTNPDVHNQISFGALTGNGSVKVRESGSNVNQVTLTLGGSTGTATFSGAITDTDNADDRLNLVKAGAGTQVLSGDNSYRGTTTVSFGTLLINGDSSAVTGDVLVEAVGTLGGSGTIGANVHFQNGAKFVFDAAETLTVTAGKTVTFDSFGVADILGLGASTDEGVYTLIVGNVDFTNIENKTLETAVSIGGGKSAYFEAGSLNLVVIPEPATIGMLGFGALLTLAVRRKLMR